MHNRTAKSQAGIGLIEVMVAMIIGLFLVGGMQQVFSSARLTYRVHEGSARMQETGRIALEVIARDIRMAGFWGCASETANVVNNLNAAGANYIDFEAGGVAGVEGGAGVADSITLRGGNDLGEPLQAPYGPAQSSALNIAAGNGLALGDFILVSDCTTADVFQLSNADADATGSLAHTTGAGSPGNDNVTNPGCAVGTDHCLSKIYGADAMVYAADEVEYRLDVPAGDEPMLLRNGEEFLDGVEDLQILYGEDTDAPGAPGAGVANYYVPADQVTDMTQIISVRFAIVVRSEDDSLMGDDRPTYTVLGDVRTPPDGRLRQVYTSTVTVRNRL